MTEYLILNLNLNLKSTDNSCACDTSVRSLIEEFTFHNK